MRRFRLSIRARLTLQYAAAFFFAGALLVLVTYLLARDTLTDRQLQLANSPLLTAFGKAAQDDDITVRDADNRLWTFDDFRDKVAADQQRLRDEALRNLVLQSLSATFVVGLLAAGTGWWLAGRTLRPLHRITETARGIADRNLGERIRLVGPKDELKELADTFDAMLERLDRAFDGQRRFVANASHELRTPLTVSRTLLQVALARPNASDDLRTLARALLEVNDQQRHLTDGLLALARGEHGPDEFTDVDLADVIRRVTDSAASDAHAAGVTVHADHHDVTVRGDPVLLQTLLGNLVLNGVRHNHRDGWVRIETSCDHGAATLTVANTGPAVRDQDVDVIFEPFRRLGNERTGEGAGLGLSIVRSIAVAHGGRVTARPRPGGGLVVDVMLPGHAVRPVRSGSSSDSSGGGKPGGMSGSTSDTAMPDRRTTPSPISSTEG